MNKTLSLSLSVVAVFVLILSAMPGVSSAEGQSVLSDCVGDAQNLCPGMKPGDGQLMNCLMQNLCPDMDPGGGVGQLLNCLVKNEAQLSAACAQRVQAMDTIRKQCEPDARNLCPGINQGARLLNCIKEHQSELTNECYDALQNGLWQPTTY